MKRLIALFTALALGVLFTSTMFRAQPAYAQGGNEDCPAGTIQVAKFNWDDEQGAFVLEGPNPGNVVISNVSLDDDDEPTGADWTSDVPISVIIVKAGPGASQDAVNPPATSGSFSTDAPPAISNVKFCSPIPEDTGTVIIEKVVVGNPPASDWGFTASAAIFPGAQVQGTLDAAGESITINNVPVGDYTVTEDDPSSKGFALTGLTCEETNAGPNASSADKDTRTATIRLDKGETVKCIFTNERLPEVKLNLTAECRVGDLLYWRVTGDDETNDVEFTWDGPNANDGQGIVDAGQRSYFTTVWVPNNPNTTKIKWFNPATGKFEEKVKAHNNAPCVYHVVFEKSWMDGPAPQLNDATILTAESSLATATCGYTAGIWGCTYTRKSDNSALNDLEVPFGESYSVNEIGVPGWQAFEGVGSGFENVDNFDANALPNALVYLLDQTNRYCVTTPNQPFNPPLDKFCTHTVVNKPEKTTAISLASFEVEANDGRAMIIWETATEIDNAGFNLYRAASPAGPWVQINSALIGAEGDSVSGAHYSFVDTPGRGIFYYRLEDVDFFGKTVQHNPVVAQLGPAIRVPWFRPTLPSLD